MYKRQIFYVNWFRKDADGKFLWPGFGENSRVLEWVFRRCNGEGETVETPIGLVPAEGELDLSGLDISDEAMHELLTVDDETDLIVRSIRLGNTSMTSELAIERGGETVAEGTLRHVFVDSNGGGTSPIPSPVRAGLERYG